MPRPLTRENKLASAILIGLTLTPEQITMLQLRNIIRDMKGR